MPTIIDMFPHQSAERKFFAKPPQGERELEEEILAMTLFGGNFPYAITLLELVALTLVRRAQLAATMAYYRHYFGKDIVAVCIKHQQYTAWQYWGRRLPSFYRYRASQEKKFATCQRVARRALSGVIDPFAIMARDGRNHIAYHAPHHAPHHAPPGPSRDAQQPHDIIPTHFHRADEKPDWAFTHAPCHLVEDYYFYDLS